MKRRILLISVCCTLAAALLVGGFFAWRSFGTEPVKVYAVSDIGYYDWYYSGSSSSGEVRSDNIQTVYLSETQQVTSVAVTEGQTVKKGDILLSYDSSLSALELSKKQLEIDKTDREIKKAKEEYNSLAGYAAYPLSFFGDFQIVLLTQEETVQTEPVETAEEPSVPALPGEKDEDGRVSTYFLVGGSGTKDAPYLYVIGENIPFDDVFLSALLLEQEQAYVVFARCEDDLFDGIVTNSWGICFTRNENSEVGFSLFTTDGRLGKSLLDPTSRDELEELPDDPIIDPGPVGPSWEEIQMRKKELEQQIREGDIQLRMAKLELARMQRELGDGNIYADFDGTVTFVGDPETAQMFFEPVVKLSAGGGYYINGSVSELALSSVQAGQTVVVSAWESGTFCEGVVTEVSTTPSPDMGWSSGNPNVTYYIYTVFVDGSNDLKEGEWVGLTLGEGSEENEESAFFLDKAFILQENGKSYVYVQGDGKKLEKREIITGRDAYGSAVELCGGIDEQDYIAFPYASDVKVGARTVESKIDELYGY